MTASRQGIYFVASARDYHAVDWYRAVKKLCPGRPVGIVTDLVQGEGFERIVDERDEVVVLFPADRLLMTRQSRLGNLWRNIVKMAALPIIAVRLNRFSARHGRPILHAHSMYYIFLCWAARVSYIATPMGSDVLVRPDQSWAYRLCTILSLRRADVVTVDSVALVEKIQQLAGVTSELIQNGIDAPATRGGRERSGFRPRVVSVRGVDPNYRILELVEARNRTRPDVPLELLYPFQEEGYRARVRSELRAGDVDHGRLGKAQLFEVLADTRLVISIPISDSSPRSVYEAIFCGCIVAVVPGQWIDVLPASMRARLYLVDLASPTWFADALAFAEVTSRVPFVPDQPALDAYDEETSMKLVCRRFYGEMVA
jgi:hypothetical protein